MRQILIYKAIGEGEKKFQAEGFVNAFVVYEQAAEPGSVTIRFNSPGGSVFDGFAIISKIEETRLKVHGILDGVAASMAAFIALRCDKLTMNRNAKIMLHLPKTTITGDASDLRNIANSLDDFKNRFAIIIAERAGITTAEAEAKYLQPGKDVWLTAPEALAAGLIDEITGAEQLIPIAASADELYEIYAQLIDNSKKQEMDKERLVGLLGSQANAEMTDDEIFAMLDTMFAEHQQLTAVNIDLVAKVQAFVEAQAQAKIAEVNVLLKEAIEAKKITVEQKPKWDALFVADYTNAKALLAEMTPPQTIKEFIKINADATETELVAEYRKADKKGTLATIKANDPEKFKAMFKATFKREYTV